jgi:hypothetical protein
VNNHQRWVVNGFLAELRHVKLNDPPPLYRQDRLLRLSRMVVFELVGECDDEEALAARLDELDAESRALVALADVVNEWCFDPTDPLVVLRFLAARRAHVAALAAQLDDAG